jgi:hypothetical protein
MKHKFLLPIAALLFCLSAQAQTQITYLKVASSHRFFSGTYHELEHTNYHYDTTNPHSYQSNVDRWSFDSSRTYYPRTPSKPIFGFTQTFDAQGRVAFVDHDSWDPFGVHQPGQRTAYTYDNNGTLLTAATQKYVSPGVYTNVSRLVFIYNANNQVTDRISEGWNTGTGNWVESARVTYTYNSSNQLIEEMNVFWNGYTKTLYSYTGNNNTEIVTETRNGSTGSTFRWFNSFDANGWLTGSERQEWVYALSIWKNMDSLVLTHDNAGNVLLRESRGWDGNAYVPKVANSYTWVPTATPSGFSMASNTAKTWNSTANIYEPVTDDDSISYFHDVMPVSVANTYKPAPHISIFPNPAGGFVNIDALPGTNYNVIIIDMAGKIVKSFSGNQHRLDVQDIPAGNYLLQVHAGGAVAVEKLVIAR